jgi:hypothetical protein
MSKQDCKTEVSKYRALFDSIVANLDKWLAFTNDDYLMDREQLPTIPDAEMLEAFASGEGKDGGNGFRVRDAILAHYSNPELSQRGVTDATEQCATRERVADYFQAWCQERDLTPSSAPAHLIVMMAGLLHYNAVERYNAYAHASVYVDLLGGKNSDNSLAQLLEMAFRNNVPAYVWQKSIDEVTELAYAKLDTAPIS